MTKIRQKIKDLVQQIYVYGTPRYIKRLTQGTKELTNTTLEFESIDILNLKLTENEKEVLDDENQIVLPLIQSQLDAVVTLLISDKLSRRGLVYNHIDDLASPVYPCLSVFHFLCDKTRLNLTVFIRSSNVEKMLAIDLVFLNDILISISKKLELEAGKVSIFISSAHIIC
jgi:hypothetical protein